MKNYLSRIGATVIYVTHDQVEALTLSHRTVVLNAGIIQQIGAPEEVYIRPKNVFVATFAGSPKINLLESILEDSKIRCNSLTFPLGNLITSEDPSLDTTRSHIFDKATSLRLNFKKGRK